MTLALATFIGSAAVMVLMLLLKLLQVRVGVLLFWPRTRNKIEVALQRKTFAVQSGIYFFTHRQVYVIMHYVLTRIRRALVRFQRRLDRRANHIMNVLSGKEPFHMPETATHILDIARMNRHKKK